MLADDISKSSSYRHQMHTPRAAAGHTASPSGPPHLVDGEEVADIVGRVAKPYVVRPLLAVNAPAGSHVHWMALPVMLLGDSLGTAQDYRNTSVCIRYSDMTGHSA